MIALRRATGFIPKAHRASHLPGFFSRGIIIESSPDGTSRLVESPSLEFASSSSQHPFAEHDPTTNGLQSSQSHGSGPSSEAGPSNPGGTVITSLPAPPQPSPLPLPPHLQHPFDTHAFVSYLEKSELERPTSLALMTAVKELIIQRKHQAIRNMLGKEDMENAAYLFRAALSELRTELSVRARNDSLALKTMAGAIQREVDSLEQKLKEDIQTLKHDIEMDMNNRKAENKSEQKGLEISIEEINNKFTISLGDLKTEIESTKWDATRRAISIIIVIVLSAIGVSVYTANIAHSAAQVPKVAPTPPAPMKDMAVGTDDDLLDDGDSVGISDQRLEKLLSDSVGKVELPHKTRPRSKSLDAKRDSLKTLDVDRI